MVSIIMSYKSHYSNHIHILIHVFFNYIKTISEFDVNLELHERLTLQ